MQERLSSLAGPYAAGLNQRRHQTNGRIQYRQSSPTGIGQSSLDKRRSAANFFDAAAQSSQEFFAAGPLAPGVGGNREGVAVNGVQKLLNSRPAPPGGRIHDLHQPAAQFLPDNHKMGEAVGQAHDDDGRQRRRLVQQQMIQRDHDLFGIKAQLVG